MPYACMTVVLRLKRQSRADTEVVLIMDCQFDVEVVGTDLTARRIEGETCRVAQDKDRIPVGSVKVTRSEQT